MEGQKLDRKNLKTNENNRIEINVIKEIKEEKYETKSSCSTNNNSNLQEKTKENKGNLQKNLENIESKNFPKNNINEIDKRINNFINYSNSNLRNRYYSSSTSNHIFRNFIKKANYNKFRDNSNENCIQNYFNELRPYSFTSRASNNNIDKGLNFILGNINQNNMNQKEIIDRKRDGYDYKKYHRGKRNNYINKTIFFNENKILSMAQNIQNSGTNFNNNYPQNGQLLNNFNNNENFVYNRNNMTSSKQKFLHMNDFLILNNLDMKIRDIGNSVLNYISNNINSNNIPGQNYNIPNIESNSFSQPIKLINPEYNNITYKNNSNIGFNSMDFNMNIRGNPFFGT